MKQLLVTGANGQLAKCIQDAVSSSTDMNFIFTTREQLDVTNKASIQEIFSKITSCTALILQHTPM